MMNRLTCALCTFLFFASAIVGRAGTDGVRVDYDKFKNVTTVSTGVNEFRVAKGDVALYGSIALLFDGQTSKGITKGGGFGLVSRADHWEFLREQENLKLIILADDNRIESRLVKFTSEIQSGPICAETMLFFIGPDDLVKIADAKVVACQVGNVEFDLSAAQVEAVKQIAIRTGLESPPPIIVAFEDTPKFSTLSAALDTAAAAIVTAKRQADDRINSDQAYVAATKELRLAEERKNEASGEERLAAAHDWLTVKQKADKIKADLVANDHGVRDAEDGLATAREIMARERAIYNEHPSTRPAPASSN